MKDLSVLIPARNEMFLTQTVKDVLEHARADTEVIVICDGNWPDPPLLDHPKVIVVHHTESIGQRAATNEAARISQAKYIMKLDAHCSLDEGFDVKLMEDCQYDWTMVPTMYGLHAFDWMCLQCGNRTYQGFRPESCKKCQGTTFEMVLVWQPRQKRMSLSWIIDSELHFQYSREANKRAKKAGDLVETMSCVGCCMFLERERYWELDGMDENHGSWGQFGCEIACKSWLSGGKLITTKKTWQAHLFRTGNFSTHGQSSFPYPISGTQQERAKRYSRDLWRNNRWKKQVFPLSWLIEKFWPVKGWTEEDLQQQRERESQDASQRIELRDMQMVGQ